MKHVKKMLAWLVGILMVLSMMPVMAFADTGNEGDELSLAAAANPVITVYLQEGEDGTPVEMKAYTQAELEALATITTPTGYLMQGHNDAGWQVCGTDNAVPVLDLLAGAGVTFKSGDQLLVTAEDGFSSPLFNWQDINNANKFYPATTNTATDTDSPVTVVPVIALTSGSYTISSTAGVDLDSALTGGAKNRFLIGLNEENYLAKVAAGKRFATDVASLTVVAPTPIDSFKVYTKIGEDEPVLAKEFNRAELVALAKTNTLGFLQNRSGAWSVHATNKYIPLADLLSAAGVAFESEDTLRPQAADGFGTTFTYDAIQAGQYFYPGTTATATDAVTPPTETGAVLALDWGSANVVSTAGSAIADALSGRLETSGRFYIGLSEVDYLAGTAAGGRFVTGPTEIIISKPLPILNPELAEGVYIIRTIDALSATKAFDIYGGLTTDGAKLETWENTTTANQRFALTKDADGFYTITNVKSGKVLDVAASQAVNGKGIAQWTSHGGDNQKWAITVNDDNSYTISPKLNDELCLDVEGSSTGNGANILIFAKHDTANQRFVFEEVQPVVAEGTYVVGLTYTDMVLDAAGGGTADGTNVQLWTPHGGQNQAFTLVYDSATGYYAIVNEKSEKPLDVAASGTANGTNVTIWASHGGWNQKWTILEESPGVYGIFSACSGLALDATAAGTTDGTNVATWAKNHANPQKWTFTAVS